MSVCVTLPSVVEGIYHDVERVYPNGCTLSSWVVDGSFVHTACTRFKEVPGARNEEDVKAEHIALLTAKVKEARNGRGTSR